MFRDVPCSGFYRRPFKLLSILHVHSWVLTFRFVMASMRFMVFKCLDNFLCFSLSSRTSHYENTQCYFSVGLPRTVCAFLSLTLDNILQQYVPRNTVAKWSNSLDLTTIPEARRILLVVSHFNLSVLASETSSVSLCREIGNVFGAVRACFDHVLSKFSGFSWERIPFLNAACVNMVMQIQVQIGDTRRVFFLWIRQGVLRI